MINKKPETLIFADDRPTSVNDDLYQWAGDTEDMIRSQHVRIVELEKENSYLNDACAELEAQLVAAPQGMQPAAWAAVYFSGPRMGKIYTTCDTEQQCNAYIAQVHQSNDSITLTAKPIYIHPIQQGLDAHDKQWKETRLVGTLGEMIAHLTWDGKNPPVFSVTRGKFVDSGSRVLSAHAACHALGVFLQEHAEALAAQSKQGGV